MGDNALGGGGQEESAFGLPFGDAKGFDFVGFDEWLFKGCAVGLFLGSVARMASVGPCRRGVALGILVNGWVNRHRFACQIFSNFYCKCRIGPGPLPGARSRRALATRSWSSVSPSPWSRIRVGNRQAKALSLLSIRRPSHGPSSIDDHRAMFSGATRHGWLQVRPGPAPPHGTRYSEDWRGSPGCRRARARELTFAH